MPVYQPGDRLSEKDAALLTQLYENQLLENQRRKQAERRLRIIAFVGCAWVMVSYVASALVFLYLVAETFWSVYLRF